MTKTKFTKTKDNYRWVLVMRGHAFAAYPQKRCFTDSGRAYFKHLGGPVSYFQTEAERSAFISCVSAKDAALQSIISTLSNAGLIG